MEERYQLMAALGVRSIQQFNERCEKELAAGNQTFRLSPGPTRRRASRSGTARSRTSSCDRRARRSDGRVREGRRGVAAAARADGARGRHHLVLATQRPSVDVLTGVIKANFPARISFQVSSKIDSRTVLDQNGADQLLGSGDMLFLPPGTSKMQRLHGAFVTEGEVGSLTGFLREQGAPCFEEDLVKFDAESEGRDGGEDDVDEMYDQAVAIVAHDTQRLDLVCAAPPQDRYTARRGSSRHMERQGVVGPQVGTRRAKCS